MRLLLPNLTPSKGTVTMTSKAVREVDTGIGPMEEETEALAMMEAAIAKAEGK